MARLDWASLPSHYEDGVSQAALYSDGDVFVWNGLVEVTEGASGSLGTDQYFDGRRLVVSQEIGDFEAAVSAYTYPDILDEQASRRRRFGLTYRTQHSAGDRIHIVYNALIKTPNTVARQSLARAIVPGTFTWDIQASAVNIPGARPSSRLMVDTAFADPDLVALIEGWLYGTPTEDPMLPDPEELVDIFEAATTLRITQHGDGTWTATGPDHLVVPSGDGTFSISAPTALFLDVDKFRVQSF
jgi:hypothetical protein